MAEKLSYEEFVRQAILKLRTGDFKGIHSVYSGFNLHSARRRGRISVIISPPFYLSAIGGRLHLQKLEKFLLQRR
jgi:hypothetical protein